MMIVNVDDSADSGGWVLAIKDGLDEGTLTG